MKLNELKAKQHKSKRTTLQQVRQWRYELIPFLNKAADNAANVAGRTCNALTSVPSVAVVFVFVVVVFTCCFTSTEARWPIRGLL